MCKKEWVDPSWGNKKKKKKIEEGQNSLVKVLKNKYKRHVNPKSSKEYDFW